MSMPEKTQQYFANRIWTIVEIGVNNNHTLEEIDSALEQLQTEMTVQLVSPRIEENYMNRIAYAKGMDDIERLTDDWYANHLFDEKATARIERACGERIKKEGWKI